MYITVKVYLLQKLCYLGMKANCYCIKKRISNRLLSKVEVALEIYKLDLFVASDRAW
jgi:hypothetical protein